MAGDAIGQGDGDFSPLRPFGRRVFTRGEGPIAWGRPPVFRRET
jgi:hypothetical protein